MSAIDCREKKKRKQLVIWHLAEKRGGAQEKLERHPRALCKRKERIRALLSYDQRTSAANLKTARRRDRRKEDQATRFDVGTISLEQGSKMPSAESRQKKCGGGSVTIICGEKESGKRYFENAREKIVLGEVGKKKEPSFPGGRNSQEREGMSKRGKRSISSAPLEQLQLVIRSYQEFQILPKRAEGGG